jgi:Zn-finger nucleic acid-binding protein
VLRDVLADILCSAETGGALGEGFERRGGEPIGEIRYIPCPLCHAPMNRVNFGRVSGVIVDVCRMHGPWFDAGELTNTVAFAASGGLERTRAREAEERRLQEQRERSVKVHEQLALSLQVRSRADPRLEAWREFLSSVLFR